MRLVVAALAAFAVAAGAGAAAATDGDPASDVLPFGSVYLPPDLLVSKPVAKRLGATIFYARKAGYPIKIAFIPTADDLGLISHLWKQPRAYAKFLGNEIGYSGPLLVVMPVGFGFFKGTDGYQDLQHVVAGKQVPHGADATVNATIDAVHSLAVAGGHPFSIPSGSGSKSSSSTWRDRILIAVGAAVLLTLAIGGPILLRRRRAQT